MRTEQLKAFFDVVDNKSFNSASNKTFVSKQALMKQVSSLEEELGFPLITRSIRGVELTPAGKAFYHSSRLLYNDLFTLRDKCRFLSSNSNFVRIANAYMPIIEISDAIEAFVSLQSTSTLQVTYHTMTEESPLSGIFNNIYDAVILNISPDYQVKGIEYTKIGFHRLYGIVGPQHPLAAQAAISLEDIAGYSIGMRSLKRKEDIVNSIRRINPDAELIEHFGNETEFIYNHCFMGGVYLSRAPFAKHLIPLKAAPITPTYSNEAAIYYLENCTKAVRDFVRFVKEYYMMHDGGCLN